MGEPTLPSQPTNPGYLDGTSSSSTSATPDELTPTNPSQPEDPLQSEEPEQPVEPDQPVEPEQPVSTGTQSCEQIMNCLEAQCSGTDLNCQDQCVSFGTSIAQQEMSAFLNCYHSAGCATANDPSCSVQNCEDELLQCIPDLYTSRAPSPPNTCLGIWECMSACNSSSCRDRCFDAGGVRAQNAFRSISNCMLNNNCDDSACVERFCSQEYATCEAN